MQGGASNEVRGHRLTELEDLLQLVFSRGIEGVAQASRSSELGQGMALAQLVSQATGLIAMLGLGSEGSDDGFKECLISHVVLLVGMEGDNARSVPSFLSPKENTS